MLVISDYRTRCLARLRRTAAILITTKDETTEDTEKPAVYVVSCIPVVMVATVVVVFNEVVVTVISPVVTVFMVVEPTAKRA